MNEGFLLLLMICASMTTLITEAVKKTLADVKKSVPNNILAGTVSVITSGGVSAGWIILKNIELTPETWVCIVALVILSWLCAMLGYDKVKQTLGQLKEQT